MLKHKYKKVNDSVRRRVPVGEVIFITEGGSKIGLGHLMRCVAVAEYVRGLKLRPFFIVNNDKSVFDILKKYRFDFRRVSNTEKGFAKYVNGIKNKPVLIDSKKDLSRLIKRLQKDGCKVSLLDNVTNARLYADNVIYPVEHFNPRSLTWKGAKGKVYYGAKYFPLRKELIKANKKRRSRTNDILISFGGADPKGLTLKVLRVLKSVKNNINIKVLIGPAFKIKDKEKIVKLASASKGKINIFNHSCNYKNLFKNTNLCITALGISIYEFNYFEIPIVLLNNYIEDSKDAAKLERLRIVKSLGYFREVSLKTIKKHIECFIEKGATRVEKYVDGKGAKRVGQIIVGSE